MIVIGTITSILPPGIVIGDLSSWVAAIATLGLLVAAIVGGYTAIKTLRTQHLTERRRRVYDLLGRVFDEDFIGMGIVAQEFFAKPPRTAAGWARRWSATTADKQAVIQAVMNFYEIVAGEYNAGDLLDRDLADKALMFITYAWWKRAAPFVDWVAVHSDSHAYEEWRAAAEAFAKAHPEADEAPAV
jgi:hypothetical protein